MTLPGDVLAALGLVAGDPVWICANPDRPGTLLVLPGEVMSEIFRKGWTAI